MNVLPVTTEELHKSGPPLFVKPPEQESGAITFEAAALLEMSICFSMDFRPLLFHQLKVIELRPGACAGGQGNADLHIGASRYRYVADRILRPVCAGG